MIECETYNSDEQLAKKETYTRDNDGKIIEQCDFKPDGSLGIKIACKYNNGDLIEENVYNAEGKCIAITTYNYTYDSNNNWLTKETYIKNTTTNNNRFKSKEVRTIEYYD